MARLIATWSLPTQREEGEPFDAATELKNSEIKMSADGGTTWTPEALLSPSETQFIVDNIAPGTYLLELVFIDTDNRRSGAASGSAKELGPPMAASDFMVTIE